MLIFSPGLIARNLLLIRRVTAGAASMLGIALVAAGAVAAQPERPTNIAGQGEVSEAGVLLGQWLGAQNAGDSTSVMQLFADDATFEGAPLCLNVCEGKAEIQRELERRFGDQNQHLIIRLEVRGNTATALTDVRSNAVRSAGIERTIRIETIAVRDGRISAYCYTLDDRDPDTAKFVAARAPGTVLVQCTTLSALDLDSS